MIDLHSHVLPGVDDGVRTLEEAVDLARAAAAEGVRAIAATPHVRDDFPTSADAMENGVARVNAALRDAGVDLRILPGGEIALDRLARISRDELRRYGLGGNPNALLLEFPYYGWPLDLHDVIFRLRTQGVTPVIAHPERNDDVRADPERLRSHVDAGALMQLTSSSLDGRLGRTIQSGALRLLELELAHLIASDAHHPGIRVAGMRAAAEAVGDPRLARWLTSDVPEALVRGDAIPQRPHTRRAERGSWRRILRR